MQKSVLAINYDYARYELIYVIHEHDILDFLNKYYKEPSKVFQLFDLGGILDLKQTPEKCRTMAETWCLMGIDYEDVRAVTTCDEHFMANQHYVYNIKRQIWEKPNILTF